MTPENTDPFAGVFGSRRGRGSGSPLNITLETAIWMDSTDPRLIAHETINFMNKLCSRTNSEDYYESIEVLNDMGPEKADSDWETDYPNAKRLANCIALTFVQPAILPWMLQRIEFIEYATTINMAKCNAEIENAAGPMAYEYVCSEIKDGSLNFDTFTARNVFHHNDFFMRIAKHVHQKSDEAQEVLGFTTPYDLTIEQWKLAIHRTLIGEKTIDKEYAKARLKESVPVAWRQR